MITRGNIKHFLKKQGMSANELAKRADVWRWSLRRYLSDKTVSITLRTASKLELAMQRIEAEKQPNPK